MLNVFQDLGQLSQLPSEERLLALERIIPMDVVQEILRQTGHDQRHCRRLPHSFMVFFVIGLSLFAKDDYRQVFKWLQRFQPGGTPGRSTLAEARKGLGIAPLRLLNQQTVRLLGTRDTPGAFYQDMRTMAIDGFVVDVYDSAANTRIFGKPQSGRSEGAFPQARVLALCETGSHVLYRWQVKPIARGEVSMVPSLLRHLESDMLLLWDRAFLSYENLRQVQATGANLLARVKSNFIFEPIRVLADGSFVAKMYPSSRHRDKDQDGIEVRIIEYTLEGRGTDGEVHRLLTTLLDAEQHPADALIVLYHERWEEELTIDELTTHQLERPVLRSQTPGGVIQEIEGLMLSHFVIRSLMQEAAAEQGLDPDRLSFTATLKILRCRLPEVPKDIHDRVGRARWFDELLAEIGEQLLPPRRDRVNPRVIKRKMSKWPKKRPKHRNPPKPAKPFKECIIIT
jgi:hypothetical protein